MDRLWQKFNNNFDSIINYRVMNTSTEGWIEDHEIFEILNFDNHQLSKYTSTEGLAEVARQWQIAASSRRPTGLRAEDFMWSHITYQISHITYHISQIRYHICNLCEMRSFHHTFSRKRLSSGAISLLEKNCSKNGQSGRLYLNYLFYLLE